jgi:hypothetical protein
MNRHPLEVLRPLLCPEHILLISAPQTAFDHSALFIILDSVPISLKLG